MLKYTVASTEVDPYIYLGQDSRPWVFAMASTTGHDFSLDEPPYWAKTTYLRPCRRRRRPLTTNANMPYVTQRDSGSVTGGALSTTDNSKVTQSWGIIMNKNHRKKKGWISSTVEVIIRHLHYVNTSYLLYVMYLGRKITVCKLGHVVLLSTIPSIIYLHPVIRTNRTSFRADRVGVRGPRKHQTNQNPANVPPRTPSEPSSPLPVGLAPECTKQQMSARLDLWRPPSGWPGIREETINQNKGNEMRLKQTWGPSPLI